MSPRPLLALALTLLLGCQENPAPAPSQPTDAYDWFSLPIELTNLPSAPAVPVTHDVNFSALLTQLHVPGVVDPHSLTLTQLPPARTQPVPVQFTPDLQPRARPTTRSLLPSTPASVSYLAEFPAGATPPNLTQSGRLTWFATADASGSARYRLRFGVLKQGSVVQVPYAPFDFKSFDATGRATQMVDFPRMRIRPQLPIDAELHFTELESPITTYRLGPAAAQARAGHPPFRRPFFYPVFSPQGHALTDFGKPHDPAATHAHHYSIWIAHNNVAGTDFWSETAPGLIAGDPPQSAEDGPVFSRLVHATRWIASAADLLHERRQITVYRAADNVRLIDIDLEFATPADKDVVLGKTSFGFLAVRVAASMNVFDGGGEILNSAGDRNERGAHLKHADWLDQSGPVAPNQWAGIAILDHPDNPRHPTAWHCRNDGWACAAFTADAPYTLTPAHPLRLRYRLVLHEGDAATARIPAHHAAYAATPHLRTGPASANPHTR